MDWMVGGLDGWWLGSQAKHSEIENWLTENVRKELGNRSYYPLKDINGI